VQVERPKATTLRDLLVEMRQGFNMYAPILIEVEAGSRLKPGSTIERTMTIGKPLDWAEQYSREYAGHSYLVLAHGQPTPRSDAPISIGRSRKCDLRLDNDSVSKLHASVVFDSGTGDYYIVDESSRNGTCINGEPVEPGVRSPIWSGAYVSFGDALFVFIDPPTLKKLSILAV
jgi:hypothetical protein